ncbi:hypothetical protein PISMIDRAFT_291322 [Pisolithus microcarpus 441]|uniref:Uncharacterized protein n=1 Tax=Pisolithus microcarpus 441 TaxID=765257 RepID=A0A0C9YPE7_9AGAM|nr:hypothetical protein PISMIDRAFT_291322 [Pisolithus microcarpus 441]
MTARGHFIGARHLTNNANDRQRGRAPRDVDDTEVAQVAPSLGQEEAKFSDPTVGHNFWPYVTITTTGRSRSAVAVDCC